MGISTLFVKEKNVFDNNGTPGYMAPEIILDQPQEINSDYFSIGVLLYEFMNQRRPYQGKTRMIIKDLIISKEIKITESEIPLDWTIEAANLINKLLVRDPNKRVGKNGISEIKYDPWFKDIDWTALYYKEIIPPFTPQVIL